MNELATLRHHAFLHTFRNNKTCNKYFLKHKSLGDVTYDALIIVNNSSNFEKGKISWLHM